MNPEDFDPLELDALRELMNISFGRAAASLSEVIDVAVVLSVPRIDFVRLDSMAEYIRGEAENSASFNMVEQFFFGRFEGSSFLLLPEEEGRRLVSMLTQADRPEGASLDALERETVMEIGNIIIGACVGKLAELLGDVVTYRPPKIYTGPFDSELLKRYLSSGPRLALVMKTLFQFEYREVYGLLFLVMTNEGIAWLRRAVSGYIERTI